MSEPKKAPQLVSTGKFLQPQDLLQINDLKLAAPVVQALARIIAWAAQNYVVMLQDKYVLDKNKNYEISQEGEIFEVVADEAGPKGQAGITLH